MRSGSITLSAAAMHSFARFRYSSPVAISPTLYTHAQAESRTPDKRLPLRITGNLANCPRLWRRGFVDQISAAVLFRQLSKPQPSRGHVQQGCSIVRVRHARCHDKTLGSIRPVQFRTIHAIRPLTSIKILYSNAAAMGKFQGSRCFTVITGSVWRQGHTWAER